MEDALALPLEEMVTWIYIEVLILVVMEDALALVAQLVGGRLPEGS